MPATHFIDVIGEGNPDTRLQASVNVLVDWYHGNARVNPTVETILQCVSDIEDHMKWYSEAETDDVHSVRASRIAELSVIVFHALTACVRHLQDKKPPPTSTVMKEQWERDRNELEFFRNAVAWVLKKAPDARAGDVRPMANGNAGT